MPEKQQTINLKNKMVLFLLAVSVIAVVYSSIRYFINRDFLMVDKVYCNDDSVNCFAPDEEEGDPYKVLIFNKSAVLACTEKDESCDVDSICDDSSSEQCKIVSCLDDLSVIPKSFVTSEECFTQE